MMRKPRSKRDVFVNIYLSLGSQIYTAEPYLSGKKRADGARKNREFRGVLLELGNVDADGVLQVFFVRGGKLTGGTAAAEVTLTESMGQSGQFTPGGPGGPGGGGMTPPDQGGGQPQIPGGING